MKKILLFLLFLSFGMGTQATTTADQLYEQNNFAQALQEYHQQAKTASGDALYQAQLRMVACQYKLGQYLQAAKSAFGTDLPNDPLWKARFLLYRIRTAEQVSHLYRPLLNHPDEENDLENLSTAQWEDKINESFESLWALRSYLIYVPIEQETLILDSTDTDTKAVPTLFDFVVQQWKQRLQLSSPAKPLHAAEVLELHYKAKETKNFDVQKLLSILAEATTLAGPKRNDARVMWQVQRIMLPFAIPESFSFADKAQERTRAIELLQEIAGYAHPKQSLWNKITRAVHFSRADYGRSYAAYQAADMLQQDQQYAQAVSLCQWAEKKWTQEKGTENYYVQSCKQLADNIQKPILQILSANYTQDPAHTALSVSARNVPNLYARLYKLSEADLLALNGVKNPSSWSYLTRIENRQVPLLLKRTPMTKLVKPLSYKQPYAYTTETLILPALSHGFYAVVFAADKTFDPDKGPMQVIVLNATELALFVTAAIEDEPAKYHTMSNTTFTPNVFRIYTVNLKTGQPQPHTDITYFTDWKGTKATGKTDQNGLLSLSRKIQTNNTAYYHILPKATQNGNTALLNSLANFHFNIPLPVKLYAETDRAIYRPGQAVQLAVYGFQAAGRGWKTLPANSRVQLVVRDANYEQILSQSLTLNEYGTARSQLVLPETGLLGHYHAEISYQINKRTFSHSTSFQVEEYKRPEYEVTLDPAATLHYDKETTVSGKVMYYFGAPLEDATVEYTVTRHSYRPFYWWWYPAFNDPSTQIAHGTTHSQKDGSFSISFTPRPGKQKQAPYRFEVKLSVRDASGRSIETSQHYKASEKTTFFSASFEQGFYDENTPGTLARVKLLDVNDQPLKGKFTAEILQLENVLPSAEQEEQGRPYQQENLEQRYVKNAVLRSISKETLAYDGEETVLSLPALPEGIYKLNLSAKNAQQAELIFLVAASESKLALPEVALVQHPSYYPGSQAKILIGASQLTGPKQVEIYQDGQFLARSERTQSGVSVYSLPIKNEWRGGVSLRWFGASNWQTFSANTFLQVPYDNKQLTVSMQVPAEVKPGQKVNWALSVQNAIHAPVNAQASVRVYDKSLDYYAQAQLPFTLNNLYPKAQTTVPFSDSAFSVPAYGYDTVHHPHRYLQPPLLPSLNLTTGQMFYAATRSFSTLAGAVPAGAMVKAAAVNTRAMADMAIAPSADIEQTANPTEDRSNPSPRTDFSETAYFNPMLAVKGGKGTVNFTMPQSVTGWHIQALAFTKDANIGSYTAQTLTRKEVMVRLSLPRFLREGDQSTLVAQVSNVTNQKITAQVTLDVLVDGKNAAADFGLEKSTQTVTVPAHSNTALTWPVSVPPGVGLTTITGTVRAGKNTDAESRQLVRLPSKQRLAESVTTALETGQQTLRLDHLLTADDTRRVSSVTLRVDPGLLLTVLNTMPQVLQPHSQDALSLVSRYVPLALLNEFYKTYPLLQEAIGKLPKRSTQMLPWDNTDPARLMLAEETPWLQTARGGAARETFLTDIFNASSVAATRTQMENKLSQYQTPEGGFSWMPGGQPNEFITLRILAAYAQILRYGGRVPQTSVSKALAWLAPCIDKMVQQDAPSAKAVSYALYGAYIFTAYPKTWQAVKQAPIAKWLNYADKHSAHMTALGQTYAASAYFRLGENTKAQNYLDLVLSRMKTDPVTGSYFAPEAQSWLWYNDTLATQIATLHTLLEIRPESDKAAGLVKWLLFNRKAQQWRDTAVAAQAVYVLLEYMQRKGLLDDPSQYVLTWGDEHKTLNFEPMDFSGQLAWTKQAQNVSPQYYSAQVTKRGGLTGFVTLDAVYTTAQALPSQDGVLHISRRYLLKYTDNGREKVRPWAEGEKIPVGAQIEVQLTLTASSAFDFVVLTDPKPAGFENTILTSGWNWDALSYYTQVRDASTDFFFDRIPAGTYTLRYTLRPTLEGIYQVLPAQVQSMYAPQFSAHSGAAQLEVK